MLTENRSDFRPVPSSRTGRDGIEIFVVKVSASEIHSLHGAREAHRLKNLLELLIHTTDDGRKHSERDLAEVQRRCDTIAKLLYHSLVRAVVQKCNDKWR